ncbi:hypothetical protein M8J77_008802 [Diaphorina citri]|nr:hypothetical protein M8J77_008802 [Diaphorina citri]
MYDVRDPYLDRTITMWELNQVLKLAKKNKAPGSDEIPNEFYKNLPESSRHFLLDLFNKVFETREIPGEWSDAVLQMIHKKGDPKNPSNYRGIALVNTISKLFINIIQERIYTWAEKLKILDEGQAGFRKGRGCVDNLFTFYSVLCINLNRNKKVFCCYVDFRRAFDLVPHELLWKHLFKLGLSTHLINVVKSLYDKARVKIRTDNGYGFTDEVDMSIGLMQGLGISPLLYILFISDLVEYLKQNGVNGVTVDSTFRMIALMYADDLVLLAESDEEMQNMLNVFHRYCQEKQLVVNVDKTKIMIFRRKGRVSKKYKFTMGRDTLEIVSQYIYLGVLFTAQACFRENAKRVVNKTSSATSVVNSIWAKSRTHCWEAKQTVYKAMVKSVLMYAAEVWGARYVEQLEMAQVRYFKYMFLWPRNTPNYMVRQECGVSATSVELFRKMLGWWIKMLEMPEDRYPKICYNVLKEMEERSPLDTTHNWAAQLRERLLGLEYEQLYQEGTSRDIKNELENIIQKFEKKSKEEDMTRIQQSSYSTVYRELTEEGGGGTYLSYGMHMGKIRLASQLRIAADNCLRINVNGNYYKIDMDVVCSVHQTNEVLSSIPIVDVTTLESKMKSKVANSNYRDVSSGSSPSREVEEIMQPYTDVTTNSNDKGQDGPVDNTDWPDAPPVHKVKPEKKTPVIETQPKKRAYNGGPMFNEDSHIGGGVPDPALETIVLSLQKMAATIQTLSSQVSTTVTIVQQSNAAIEAHGAQLAALEKRVELLARESASNKDSVEDRRSQELLVSQITQAVQNIITEKIQTLIVTQFNTSLLPALLESMTPLKNQLQTELSQKLTATDHLLKENLSKVVQSKTVLDTITNAVLQNLQMNMRECFKEYFRKSLPDYQKASHAMFKQLSETFEQGVRAILAGVEANSESVSKQTLECVSKVHQLSENLNTTHRNLNVAFSQSLLSLENNINDTLTKHLSSQKAALEGAVINAVQSRTVTPVPTASSAQQMQLIQNQIKSFLSKKQYNAAFQQALTAQNLSLVLYVCENVDPSTLFDMNPCPLEQPVLISLIQQIGGDLANQSILKCSYIDEALGALDIQHSSTREHVPKVLLSTLTKLKSFSVAQPNHPAIKHVKKLERVIQGVLRDFE